MRKTMENGSIIDNGQLKNENGSIIDNGQLKIENDGNNEK